MDQNKKSMADQAYERLVEFEQTFGGSEFFEEGYIRTVEYICGLSELLFGRDEASACFDAMARKTFSLTDQDLSWRQVLEDEYNSIFSETALGQLIHDLTAYADYGIVVKSACSLDDRRLILKDDIDAAERFLSLLPLQLWKLQQEHLVKILRKALARWKLDTNKPVCADELALLSGRALQTIKNNLGLQSKPIKGNQNRIDATDAMDWLATQNNFLSSIWEDQDDFDVPEMQVEDLGEVVFVPVAADGSIFQPNHQRDGRYQIDAGGDMLSVADYRNALAQLQKMQNPYWRRPTKQGSWTRVRAIEWRRVPVSELMALAAATVTP
ncbi:hypothetical protein [Puniceibacterium sediminis]|uniref:Uncharacterized protein n=1 Tax=Puniceibacterium sediminis TaxID=1608407 RepID=A0A238Z4L7_9RHOB|nr:hypothetical protein [Puniceibacterium sediminis]SNR78375.1 hypothetical protein SAMN06265370_12427 [Puniceibacterium sediminis]